MIRINTNYLVEMCDKGDEIEGFMYCSKVLIYNM